VGVLGSLTLRTGKEALRVAEGKEAFISSKKEDSDASSVSAVSLVWLEEDPLLLFRTFIIKSFVCKRVE